MIEQQWTNVAPCADKSSDGCLQAFPNGDGIVRLRSSRRPDEEIFLDADEWAAVLAGAATGTLDLAVTDK